MLSIPAFAASPVVGPENVRNLRLLENSPMLFDLHRVTTGEGRQFFAYPHRDTTFRKNFEVPQSLIDGIYTEADKQKIERPKEEREATDERLRQTLKALIARDLWDMNEYFAIVYEDDPIVTTAVKKLSEPDLP